jgi:hypothetical protein
MDAAVAAFAYAQARSWVRTVYFPQTLSTSTAIPTLPTPAAPLDGPDVLYNSDETIDVHGVWYVVYSGITPGVYPTL